MSETVTGLRYIRGKLIADATLLALVTGVYDESAPRGAVAPYVIVRYYDTSGDVLTLNGYNIMSPLTYQVRVVGVGGSYAPLETADARIMALLHQSTGTAGSGAVYECLRVEVLQYREDVADGTTYCHLGGLYELLVKG